MVHNLPELSGEAASFADRSNHDSNLFTALVRDEMNLNIRVQRSFRVGRKPQDGRPRLFIVTLDNPSAKHDILKLTSDLRHSSKYINIYITPDLTKKEREVNKKLREELSHRKTAGETNLAIRNGKIVSKGGHRVTVPTPTQGPADSAASETEVRQATELADDPRAGRNHTDDCSQVAVDGAKAETAAKQAAGPAVALRAGRDCPAECLAESSQVAVDSAKAETAVKQVSGPAVAPRAGRDRPDECLAESIQVTLNGAEAETTAKQTEGSAVTDRASRDRSAERLHGQGQMTLNEAANASNNASHNAVTNSK